MKIDVINLNKSNRVIEVIDREPQPHAGWDSVNYKGKRYQLFGGIRGNYFVDLANPIKGKKKRPGMAIGKATKRMKKGPRLGHGPPYTVILQAIGNPDFDQPDDIGVRRVNVEAPTLRDAAKLFSHWRDHTAHDYGVGLGGGNMGRSAGLVKDKIGRIVARIAYNGSMWEMDPMLGQGPEVKL